MAGSSEPARPGKRLHRLDCLAAILIFCAVALSGLHTVHQIGISDDEPFYFRKAKEYCDWFANFNSAGSLAPATLERTFGFDKDYDSHPTLTKLAGALSYALLKDSLGGFWAYRMSAVFMFGLLLALVYLRVSGAWGKVAAAGAVLCLACLPRFFINGHLATTEAPLCLFWFLTAWSFEAAGRKRRLALLAGACWGLAMSVKFTGFLLPIPLIAWALAYRRRSLWYLLPSLLLIGPLVFFLLQPQLWHETWPKFLTFLKTSTSRTQWYPVLLVFRGINYNSNPPWYYALFMVMVTAPVMNLALFFTGIARAAIGKLKDELAGACLIHFCFLIAMTMSKRAPMYDGVRLFLPAFVFLGILSGYGFSSLVNRIAGKTKSSVMRYAAGSVAAAALVALLVMPLVKIYPFGLEYYNGLIGGVKGAREHGMETAYWWTSLNEDALKNLNAALPENATLRFAPTNRELLMLYSELGLLRPDVKITNGTDFDYALILSRPEWKFRLNFFLKRQAPGAKLTGVMDRELDSVPLWVLYKRTDQ
jgi:4-amino-4-deoxy-L-arabinose transferase-like glycosyltransferase